MRSVELMVIMPVYNEEASIEAVIHEWVSALDKLNINYIIFALNDGSRDQTENKLLSLNNQYPKSFEFKTHTNRGHGQSCIEGYKLACDDQATWVLQVDSDGQCDPRYFEEFWALRFNSDAIFGFRKVREDGWQRLWMSKVLRIVVWVATGKFLNDANVPYRLIKCNLLKTFIEVIPRDVYLANMLVSVMVAQRTSIQWVPIRFRNRFGGTPTINLKSFIKHGQKFFGQMLNLKYCKKII